MNLSRPQRFSPKEIRAVGSLFYRDGFTDIRGKFEYAQASGNSVGQIIKFAILLCYKESSVIKEEEIHLGFSTKVLIAFKLLKHLS